ncbi:MAG: response regulator [Acidobacteria bacterium]|nr:response regulator [Acidobacteriota bacterium]
MPLRLVHLEDDPSDRTLVADVLRRDGLECAIAAVASRGAFEDALAECPDLILADHALPGFDGISAQELASTQCPDVPFIFVSGSIGEDFAVDRLKSGATDYVLKHRLEKLPTAVRRAVREVEDRRRRAQAEAALRRLNAELEARVAERTRALVSANEALQQARLEAERANGAKSAFLSRMSHDLRTPLNAVIGFAQLLQFDDLTPGQADSVEQILRGGRHLLDLINEVLDIARIEAGTLSLSPEPVAVGEVAHQAAELIRPLAAPRRITVIVEPLEDVWVRADRQRLNQILLNLLSNAVKYNRDDGTVVVSARRATPDRVSLVVSDTGAGIPPEKLSLLFTPFERLGAEFSGIDGTGLGLALSRGLAEAMHGELRADSVVDQGTTLYLDLPACATGLVHTTGGERAAAEGTGMTGTVLYIDDNLSNVQLMQRLLARRRPQVEFLSASDGRTGLEVAGARLPSLVLLDLHLPDMRGEEVLRQLWEGAATRHIPVAVLSADAMAAQKRRLVASGAVAYLTKPFDVGDVLQLVDGVLRTGGPTGPQPQEAP